MTKAGISFKSPTGQLGMKQIQWSYDSSFQHEDFPRNPLHAKFFRGNMYWSIYILCSCSMTQVVEILPHVRQGPIQHS